MFIVSHNGKLQEVWNSKFRGKKVPSIPPLNISYILLASEQESS
jgi:hypothetical protein